MNRSASSPVVSKRLRKLLVVTLILLAILLIDSIYLGMVTLVQVITGEFFENSFFQHAFLVHLVLGVVVLLPLLLFIGLHLARAYWRPNRMAVRLGLGLFLSILVLFISGIALTRGLPGFELKNEVTRNWIYWLHVVAPVGAIWLFVLHRLAGPKIRWRVGGMVLGTALVVGVIGTLALASRTQETTEKMDLRPALVSTAHGGYLQAEDLMLDDYCAECHQDAHEQWSTSAHRFASFNNPAYAFSVEKTRQKVLQKDGNLHAARFCAGCHDPVPLLTGKFEDPSIDLRDDVEGHAGITCLSCHAIVDIGSVRGNADYVIEVPEHYPFTRNQHSIARFINQLLVKGKPGMHKMTMLKPIHQSPIFCGTCHKVHLPVELNDYKWLRGQNHYDSFLLSGFSGHGVQSFYYPNEAKPNCNVCHMPLHESTDFGAKDFDDTGTMSIHDHMFPSANTALAHLLDFDESVIEQHKTFLEENIRVDIFGIRKGDSIVNQLSAPISGFNQVLSPNNTYVFDVVLRSLKVGHHFTQGTSDSNEIWLRVNVVADDGTVIGSSGLFVDDIGTVDPWSYFVNSFVIDRDGRRIAERNAEDIFTSLYNHQIPPGGASTVHYRLKVPSGYNSLKFNVELLYRKFDTHYVKAFQADEFVSNDLPVTTISSDTVEFAISEAGSLRVRETEYAHPVEEWLRWNDYGIAMLTRPDGRSLRQAEEAFEQVVRLGRAEGYLNLARVFIAEGRLDEASQALARASSAGAYPWSIAWFSGIVDMQNGFLDEAIVKFEALVATQFEEARKRGFDFSSDYNLRNRLGLAYFEKAKLESGTPKDELLHTAKTEYETALLIDPENVTAHYGLTQIYELLGQPRLANAHRELHSKYRIDDNARDRAITIARTNNAAANHAAEAVAIYDLQRSIGDRSRHE